MQINHNLSYSIVSKRIIGEGKIENIKNTFINKKFELLSQKDESLPLQLKLLSPAIITKIQLRLIKTYRLSLKLINSENKLVQEFAQILQREDEKVVIYPTKIQPSIFVKLKLQNDPLNKKRIGIYYVIFQGISDEIPENQKKENNKNKNKSQSHVQTEGIHPKSSNIKKDPKSFNSKKLFKERQKQKFIQNDVERLLGLSQHELNYGSKKIKLNEDVQKPSKHSQKKEIDKKLQQKQDTDLAIALSKSEQQKIDEQDDYEAMQIEEFKKKEDSIPLELQKYADEMFQILPDRKYQTVEFNEEYISIFSDLSPKWLEAQKMAEQQAEVQEEERLSKYLKIKYLVGVQIYISDFAEWKVQELKHHAKQLGCRILPQLKNHCLAIVPRDSCQKLRKKHRTWSQIKFITPQYLQDCIKHRSRLIPKDYYIKV